MRVTPIFATAAFRNLSFTKGYHKNFRLPNEIFFSKRKTFVLRFGLFVLTYERKNLVNKEEVRSESNV